MLCLGVIGLARTVFLTDGGSLLSPPPRPQPRSPVQETQLAEGRDGEMKAGQRVDLRLRGGKTRRPEWISGLPPWFDAHVYGIYKCKEKSLSCATLAETPCFTACIRPTSVAHAVTQNSSSVTITQAPHYHDKPVDPPTFHEHA